MIKTPQDQLPPPPQYPPPQNQQTQTRNRNQRRRRNRSNQAITQQTEAAPQDQPPAVAGHINMIVGGIDVGSSSSSKRKRQIKQCLHIEQWPTHYKEPEWRTKAITFSEEDAKHVRYPQCDVLVTTVQIVPYTVGRVFFDTGSDADILYYHTFKKMNIDPSKLIAYDQSVSGFNGVPVPVMGTIKHPAIFGDDAKNKITIYVDFLVVDVASSYNSRGTR